MTCEILTIGDELLIGQIINTNQAYIAERLNGVGIAVARMTTVGDDPASILEAFGQAWARADVVVVTGGLGPTHDDVTKKAVCRFFHTDLVPNNEVRRHIEQLLAKRAIPWSASAEEQSLVPRAATIVPNPVGTAPGMLFEETGKHFFVLPGVPYEMKEMIDGTIVPFLASRVADSSIRHRTLRTTGITESALAARLGNVDEHLHGATLAFLPAPRGVRLRVSAHARNPEDAEAQVRAVEEWIRSKAGEYIYSAGDEEIEEVVGRLLSERRLTIALAESCTGGLIASRLTDVSGSSRYVERCVVAYSNASKTQLLGVPEDMIARHGAVSEEVAAAMAEGIRRAAGTDIGVSTTGIAGPTGGSAEKPVGLVWIGYADAGGVVARRHRFGEGRLRVKERASQAALEMIRRAIAHI